MSEIDPKTLIDRLIAAIRLGEATGSRGRAAYRRVEVPWTTIKEIMAAIKARAALPNTTGEAE